MLKPGTRLGPYEVLSQLGAGGMGEVYKGRDTRLDRIVALKVLAPHLTGNPEARDRFEREAKTVANLKHPNICVLYDIGKDAGRDFLVLEYLEGETLAQRLTKGPLPLEQVLQYAGEISDALDKAHHAGVTHRDIKPGNVMLVPKSGSGPKVETKLLDFGLAKLKQEIAPNLPRSEWPTGMGAPTEDGRVLGTAHYMAPEQAEGKVNELDPRTDIFSFGATVYEMVTGKKAFDGKTPTSVIAAILKEDPPAMSSLQPLTPPALDHVVKTCLAKDPEDRWQTARDLTKQLEWIAKAGSQPAAQAPVAEGRPASKVWRRAAVFALVALVAAVMAGLAVWRLKPATSPIRASTAHFVIALPPGQQLGAIGFGTVMALSPDGARLAYVAQSGNAPQQIYIRTIDSLESRPLPGTEGAASPFFSPDSQWLGFFTRDKLEKIAVSGGSPVTVFNAGGNMSQGGATWGADDTIIFQRAPVGDLWRVPAAGGEPQRLQNTLNLQKGLVSARWPGFLPGANEVLFAAADNAANWYNPQLGIYRLNTAERRDLPQGGTGPRYAPTGHLLYVQNGTLMAAPFDPRRLEVTGAPVPVVEGVMQLRGGAAQYSFSDSGTLVYVQGFALATGRGTGTTLSSEQTFVWVDRNGMEQPIPAPAHAYRSPRLSPDGRRIAVAVDEPASQIWIYDIARETLTRLTFEAVRNNSPVWTPDGKRVAFGSGSPTNLFWQPADGSGKAERLTTNQNPQSALTWSPDGQSLVFRLQTGNSCNDLWVLRLSDPGTAPHKAEPFLQTPFCESAARFSPDGRWLAYLSDESGRDEIYVQPFPGPGGKWQISTEGGVEAVWNPNGRELFYRSGNKMMAVDITTQPGFSAGKPRMLFEGSYQLSTTSTASYDVSSDGQRFLMLKGSQQQQAATQIHVVLNWFEELKRKAPVK